MEPLFCSKLCIVVILSTVILFVSNFCRGESEFEKDGFYVTKDFKLSPDRPTDRVLLSAFNIRKFGRSKAKKLRVMERIVRILMRYDMTAVSEITDSSQKAIKKLMKLLNEKSPVNYQLITSKRVGRSRNKEQYALIYRSDKIKVLDYRVYDDSENDPFAREPLLATFEMLEMKDRDPLGLISIHTKPDDAVNEIKALEDAQRWMEEHMKVKDVMVMGDFNADCSYVRKKDWAEIPFRNSTGNIWLIEDDVDTTVSGTDCAYDRIVIKGPYYTESVVTGSAQPFRFDKVYGLTDDQTWDVSDHFPVEVAFLIDPSADPSGEMAHNGC